jgi:uncharacterized protein YqhQ
MSFGHQFKRYLRELAHLQLLIALEGGDSEILVGGQAVIEGVMMRAPHSYAVAVCRPDGEIVTSTLPLQRASDRHRFWKWPILRGLATLGQALVLGVKALKYSADASLGAPAPAPDVDRSSATPTEKEPSSLAMTVSLVSSLLFFIAFYKLLPLVATDELRHVTHAFDGNFMFNLADGLIRIAIFLLFIGGLSFFADIRRVYEYHGAEHKVVFNYESGKPVTIENARRFTTLHPRCGTSFMIVVMLVAMAVYMAIPVVTFWGRLAVRIAFLPLIAGLSYEIIRFAARHNRSFFALMSRPGLWLQRITTRQPNEAQLACSIRALNEAMSLEASQGGDLVIG